MKKSAGILAYRRTEGKEVFLVHPGGPFWKNKDEGSWTIPKGEFGDDEDALEAAIREFEEETGTLLNGPFLPLEPVKQKAGKWIYAWMTEADLDPAKIVSNEFQIEWPPKSGKIKSFPEVDRAEWFPLGTARKKINPAQAAFIEEVENLPL